MCVVCLCTLLPESTSRQSSLCIRLSRPHSHVCVCAVCAPRAGPRIHRDVPHDQRPVARARRTSIQGRLKGVSSWGRQRRAPPPPSRLRPTRAASRAAAAAPPPPHTRTARRAVHAAFDLRDGRRIAATAASITPASAARAQLAREPRGASTRAQRRTPEDQPCTSSSCGCARIAATAASSAPASAARAASDAAAPSARHCTDWSAARSPPSARPPPADGRASPQAPPRARPHPSRPVGCARCSKAFRRSHACSATRGFASAPAAPPPHRPRPSPGSPRWSAPRLEPGPRCHRRRHAWPPKPPSIDEDLHLGEHGAAHRAARARRAAAAAARRPRASSRARAQPLVLRAQRAQLHAPPRAAAPALARRRTTRTPPRAPAARPRARAARSRARPPRTAMRFAAAAGTRLAPRARDARGGHAAAPHVAAARRSAARARGSGSAAPAAARGRSGTAGPAPARGGAYCDAPVDSLK